MRVLLVEDRPSMCETLSSALERAGGTTVTWAPHYSFAPVPTRGNRGAATALSAVDLVLVDAFDRDQTQDHPTRSALRGLDVTARVRAVVPPDRPRIVAYSTAMADPEVDITLFSTGLVSARYSPQALLDHLPDVLAGRYPGARPVPEPSDWKRIHPDLRSGAALAQLHEMMEANDRAWRLVWDRSAPFDQAAQQWIRRNILPWLAEGPHPSYRVAVEVTRRIAGFARR